MYGAEMINCIPSSPWRACVDLWQDWPANQEARPPLALQGWAVLQTSGYGGTGNGLRGAGLSQTWLSPQQGRDRRRTSFPQESSIPPKVEVPTLWIKTGKAKSEGPGDAEGEASLCFHWSWCDTHVIASSTSMTHAAPLVLHSISLLCQLLFIAIIASRLPLTIFQLLSPPPTGLLHFSLESSFQSRLYVMALGRLPTLFSSCRNPQVWHMQTHPLSP